MTDSILQSTKKLLGLDSEYTEFDLDIQMHINTAFSVLSQLGTAPPDGFIITGESETWSDLLEDRTQIEMVKTWVYLKVRLAFDPPGTSFALNAIENQIKELDFRLNIMEILYNPDAYLIEGVSDLSDTNFKILQEQLAVETTERQKADDDILALVASIDAGSSTDLVGEWQINPQAGPPSGKQLSCDTGVFGTAQELYFVKLDQSNTDMSVVISRATVVHAQQKSNAANWIRYNVWGPMVDYGSYVGLPVNYIDSDGSIAIAQWQDARVVFVS